MRLDTGLVSIIPSKVAAMEEATKSMILLPKPYPQGIAMFSVIVVPMTLDWTPSTTSWISLTEGKLHFDIVSSELFK